MLQTLPVVPYYLDHGTYAEVLIRNLESTGLGSLGIPKAPYRSLSKDRGYKKTTQDIVDLSIGSMELGDFESCSLGEEERLTNKPIPVSSLCSPSAAPDNNTSISSIVDLYHATNLQELYGTAMRIIYGWLAWEGLGSPGSTTEVTSRLVELAQRARQRGATPTWKEISALEVVIDCRRELQRLQHVEGEDRFEVDADERDVQFM